jgi:hypothetical protein
MGELVQAFNQEKEKILLFLIKNTSGKEPKINIPQLLMKQLKELPEYKRNALLDKYFMKCRRA